MNQRQLKAAATAARREALIYEDVVRRSESGSLVDQALSQSFYAFFDSLTRILEAAAKEKD